VAVHKLVLAGALVMASVAGCDGDDDDGAGAVDAGGVVDATPTIDAFAAPDGEVCPGTCVGDAVGDFSVAPGAGDPFRYLDDTRVDGEPFADMVYGEWHGAMAWVGAGDTPEPAVMHCPSHPNAPDCQGVESRLILAPGQQTATTRDPVLAWTSPLTGMVRVVGNYRSPTISIAGKQRVTIVRNTRDDVIYDNDYMPGQAPVGIDELVAVTAGDRLLLTVAAPLSGFGAPVGFQLFFVEP
jgi:hypothetical protein